MGGTSRKRKHDAKDGTKSVTGAFGTAVGGLTRTSGKVVGTAGRGVGNTINKTTSTHKGGNAVKDVTSGVNNGVGKMANGVERGSKGRNPRSWWKRY